MTHAEGTRVIDKNGLKCKVLLSDSWMTLVVYDSGYWCIWITRALRPVEAEAVKL